MIQTAAIKSTPAEAESDAIEVLTQAEGNTLRINDFVRAMQARGVTVSAAQDTLRVLAGRGLVTFTPVGNVSLARTPAPA